MSVIKDKYNRSDWCFVLNYRGEAVKTSSSPTELKEKTGQITETEHNLLKNFRTPSPELIHKYETMGWFNKTYETVRSVANNYIRSLISGNISNASATRQQNITYNQPSEKITPIIKIVRLLYFYELKGYQIPIRAITLSNLQKLVVSIDRGVIVVNSGPGTGKTETAAQRASKLKDSLVVSFTNAAVDSFMMRIMWTVIDISDVSKNHGKSIWVTTIDSLANKITPRSQKSVNFKLIIETAINNIDQFGNIFLNADGTPLYKHMIIDEGQDVSDYHYEFLFRCYKRWGFESLTIVGDPRQRLDADCGGVFQRMLQQGTTDYEEDILPTIERPLVIKFNETYRFENPVLMTLCNTLSSNRPEVHAELNYVGTPIEPCMINKYCKPEDIAGDIVEKIRAGVLPCKICILSPIVKKAGKTKSQLDTICQMIAEDVMTSNEIREDCIYVSSIQSVKGLEFDYVYFIGASGYPTYMNQEYQDINDGKSMNFVANTRARKGITYLTDETMRAPDNVPDIMTIGGEARQVNLRKEVYPYAIKSSDISSSDYKKFFSSNIMSIHRSDLVLFLTKLENEMVSFSIADGQYEVISAVCASLNATTIIDGNLSSLPQFIYIDCCRKGEIYDMMRIDNKVCVLQSQREDLILLRDGYDITDLDMHKLFMKCMTRRESSVRNMDQINDLVMKIIRIFTDDTDIKQIVVNERIWCSGIASKKSTVLFTENMYLAALYKKRNPLLNVYQVGLESGIIWTVHEQQSSVGQIKYMVDILYSICTHVRLIRGRGKYSLSNVDKNKPWLFVDTEFCPRDHRKSGAIYDVAVINGYDPYTSTCSYIRMELEAYTKMNYLRNMRGLGPCEVPYSDLVTAPTPQEFYEFFCSVIGSKDPLIWYFSTKHDISIFYEFHEMYNNAHQTKSNAKEDWIYSATTDYDFRFKNARTSNAKGTMQEVYERITGSKVNQYKHILLHTAASDALLLMEYVLTRDIVAEETVDEE